MKETKIIMGMPITVEIVSDIADESIVDKIFNYFKYVDNKFSTYKHNSEISRINRGEVKHAKMSLDMKKIIHLAEKTRDATNGYFDIVRDGKIDPSGLVKGWAIYEAAKILKKDGFENFYIEAGGDIEAIGHNSKKKTWRVGIKNPEDQGKIVKVLEISNMGVATSGNYIRGQHIYNPHSADKVRDILSLTVIGPNIYEADRFATAAFAMGAPGIEFIEQQKGLEGYMIDKKGMATYTSGFGKFVVKH